MLPSPPKRANLISPLASTCGNRTSILCLTLLLIAPVASVALAQDTASQTVSNPSQTAAITGVVQDSSGAVIPDAQVSLLGSDGRVEKVVSANSEGEFRFENLSHGPFRVAITLPGLAPFLSSEITLADNQSYELQNISLAVAPTTTDVQVTATNAEIADAQLKSQESQRIFGLLPNFYTSYIHDAAPLNDRQKFSLAAHAIFDPSQFVISGIAAGVEQANRSFAGYGFGTSGYAKRYAADFGDQLTGTLISGAILPSILHQDPRYFYQGSGSKKSRFLHAIAFSVLTRGDNGAYQPNYSSIVGGLASGALSNLYYPHADRGTGLLFRNAAFGILGRAGDGLVREFILKRLTTHVPPTSNGKP